MDLATEIQTARKKLGLTAKEAAVKWDIKSRTLENWEQGIRIPRGAALKYLRSIIDPILADKPVSGSSASPAAEPPPAPPSPKPPRRSRPKPPPKRKRARRSKGTTSPGESGA